MKWAFMFAGINIGIWFVVLTMPYNTFYKKLVEKNKIEICKNFKDAK